MLSMGKSTMNSYFKLPEGTELANMTTIDLRETWETWQNLQNGHSGS